MPVILLSIFQLVLETLFKCDCHRLGKKERNTFCYGALFQDFGESNICGIMHKPTVRIRSESHEVCLFHVWEESTFSRKGMLISRTFFFRIIHYCFK